MRPVQKRGFFNFCCAFIPGASEMYMGFMKMGFSLMLTFFLGISAIGFLELSDMFMLLPMVMWFYAFFHARNLTSCRPEIFATIQDDYFWNDFLDGKRIDIRSETSRKVIAWVLIIIGVATIWNIITRPISSMFDWMIESRFAPYVGWIYDAFASLPRLVISCVIILVGVRLITGKKKQLFLTNNSYDVVVTGSACNSNNAGNFNTSASDNTSVNNMGEVKKDA